MESLVPAWLTKQNMTLYLLDFIIQRGLSGIQPNKIVHSGKIWISLAWHFLLILFQSINIQHTACKVSARLQQIDDVKFI